MRAGAGPLRHRTPIPPVLPPSLILTEHFVGFEGKRDIFGRGTQRRTGHPFTFVPSYCVNALCPQHLATSYGMHQILGTNKGIVALPEFEKSGNPRGTRSLPTYDSDPEPEAE